MVDAADMAGEIESETIAAGVALARAPIATGKAGECEQCEWWMPRLVDGRCGFCRDGRPRPPDWEPPVPSTSIQEEPAAMPAKTIQLPAAADTAIAAIEARVAETGETLGVAAAFFIMRGIAEPSPVARPDIAAFATGQLLEEVARRLTEAAGEADALRAAEGRVQQATARAEAAEGKLRSLREALAA